MCWDRLIDVESIVLLPERLPQPEKEPAVAEPVSA